MCTDVRASAASSILDPVSVRSRFPALASGTVFFDNPGGTQVPRIVVDAVADCLIHRNANLGGAFATSRAADEVVLAGRRAMADLLGGKPEEIVFGPNMTTLTLALSRSLGRELEPGSEIVVTRLDHDANVSPWLLVGEDRGLDVRFVDFDPEDCTLMLDQLESVLSERTRLVAVGWASNAVGTINPVRQIVELARAAGALTFVDAVHYAPHGPIDVAALDCDFLAVSAYKFFGPHVGALFGKGEHLERLVPYKVRPAPDESPDRWENGTQVHEGIAGATAAVDYIAGLGGASESRRVRLENAWERICAVERQLCRELLAVLASIPRLRIHGITDRRRLGERVPTVAFTVDGTTPRRVAEELDRRCINVWDGNYYALEVVRRLGLEHDGGMVRVGLVHYNTVEEIHRLGEALGEIAASV
jgi:cysteine desulfurase family protein (TIGR01976 family)